MRCRRECADVRCRCEIRVNTYGEGGVGGEDRGREKGGLEPSGYGLHILMTEAADLADKLPSDKKGKRGIVECFATRTEEEILLVICFLGRLMTNKVTLHECNRFGNRITETFVSPEEHGSRNHVM